jgi:uncharacterized protein (UPF0332 family)
MLSKAERALRAGEILLAANDPESAVGRAYYAMFHAARALLIERNLRYRKHGGVHAGFAEHLIKAGTFEAKYHRWLLDGFDVRGTAEYEVGDATDAETARTWIERAREFVFVAKRHLGAQGT